MSVYRDSGRYDDSRSVASARTSGGTKVTRYVVKEDDTDRRTLYDSRRSTAGGTRYDDRRTEVDIREDDTRSYTRGYAPEPEYRNRETITIRRNESPERRDEYWRRPPGEAVQDRELVIRRTVERDSDDRAPPRIDDRKESLALSRIDDRRESRMSDYEVVSPQRGNFDDREREVQRYIRTTDYYNPPAPQQPQTIIIRQEPIIIRERARDRSRSRSRTREEDFQIVKKSDIDDTRSVSRRSRSEHGRDEEYFYEKKVRERIPEEGDRRLRKEVSPHDSVSQAGGRRRGGYDSDDSMVYVRKERIDDYGSDEEDHKKRDLAAGALAGVGAMELIRNHNRKEGKESSQGAGRIARDIGGGVVGAVAAEAIRRYRSKSRHRSRSDSRGRGRGGDRDRDRSRSESNSKLKSVGGLGLAAAAVAAGALLASRNKNKNKDGSPDGRSRSRTRRGSRSRSRAGSRDSTIADLANDPNATDDRNPKKRNQRTAAAGALGAAAMALYERHRSKSRGRRSSESPNRIKQGAPIAIAGLGAAGLAHLYEKRKAKDEATAIVDDEDRRSRSRHRDSSRGRSNSTYYDPPSQRAFSDPNLIQYGNDPINGNNYGEGYYGRPQQEQDYYHNNTRDIVPAPAPPPAASSFDATRGRANRSISSSRSRSRSRGAAAAAAAVGAGVAASEFDRRRTEKKDRKRRSRQRSRNDSYTPPVDDRNRQNSYAPYTAGRDPYEDANWHATHSGSYAPGMNDPYASQTGFGGFPPPPGQMPQQGYTPQPPHSAPSYGPQDFPPPPAGAPQAQQFRGDPYAPGQNPYAPRRGDDNVSDQPFSTPVDQHHPTTNGINHAREIAMSPPMVGPNVTVQRPSTSTPGSQQPRTRIPGTAANPFEQKTQNTVHNSENPSPGARPGGRSPMPADSRAAKAYTPTPPPFEPRQEQDRSTPNHFTSQAPQTQVRDAPPVVTDAPTPLNNRNPRTMPEDPRVTAFRQAAYNAPMPQPQPQPQSTVHDVVTDPTAQRRQPEMQQTNRGNALNIPLMPSPDIRPPSDDAIPEPQQQRMRYRNPDESAPSMPQLFIPERRSPISQAYTPPPPQPEPERQPRRDRSRSQSQPRTAPQLDGDATPRVETPTEPKKSVSFNPKPEYSEAPAPVAARDRPAGGSEADPPEASRTRRDDPQRPRNRDRRGYDAGDDFSDDTPHEDRRRRSQDRDKDRPSQSSRRERSNTQSLDRDSGRDQHRASKRSNTGTGSSSRGKRRDKDWDESPDSDSTVDLPARFDERGKPRNPEEDLIADSLDKILGGLFGGGSGSGSSKKRL